MGLVDPAGTPIASTLTDEQLVALMVEEIRAIADVQGHAILMLEPMDFFRLVGLVQLAGRHPTLAPSNHETIAGIEGAAREYFRDCPTVLEVMARGEDPQFDR